MRLTPAASDARGTKQRSVGCNREPGSNCAQPSRDREHEDGHRAPTRLARELAQRESAVPPGRTRSHHRRLTMPLAFAITAPMDLSMKHPPHMKMCGR